MRSTETSRRCRCVLALAALAAGVCACSESSPPCRVAILGIDGATWRAIDPLVARGELPVFGALKRSGAWGDLRSLPPYNSPQMWTSIATGQPPEVHGIQNFTAQGPDGRPVPSSSNMRRSPAAWTIATRFGRSVGVAGWYVTWPAERVNGFVLTDHLRPAKESAVFWPVSAEQEAALRGRTYPEELLASLRGHFVTPENVDREEMREDLRLFGVSHPYLKDETIMRMGLHLLSRHHPDLFLLYQHGTDVMQHIDYGHFERYLAGEVDLERQARRVINYYRYQDDNVRRLVEAMGGHIAGSGAGERIQIPPRHALLVVSDHGFGPGTRPSQPALTGDHLPDGIVAIVGEPAWPGHRLTGASVLDVLPTALHLMGIPIARDLPGRVLEEALTGNDAEIGERKLASYPYDPTGGPPVPSPLDEQIMAELRALGYVQ